MNDISRPTRPPITPWKRLGLLSMAGLLLGGLSMPAMPANGIVTPGNGTTQLGLAGAGTAMTEDAAATLRNPAAAAWISSEMTVDLGLAIPQGEYTVGPVDASSTTGLMELGTGRYTSAEGVFPVPAFARNWRIGERQAVGIGVTVAGVGSLSSGDTGTLGRGVPLLQAHCDGAFSGGAKLSANTDSFGLCGNTGAKLGVSISQVLMSAHWAYRLRPDLSFGVAPVLLVQRLNVRGFGAFKPFSNYPEQTTDRGNDRSFGGGLRAGMLWEIGGVIDLGLAVQSRLYTTPFNRYRGSIVGGKMDSPPIYDLGLQFHLGAGQRLLLDVEHIAYSEISPLSHRTDSQRFTDDCFVPRIQAVLVGASTSATPSEACLGGADGPGLGWNDMTVYKLGYQIQVGRLKLRAGYSYGHQPVGDGQILSAVIAPAITSRHASLGSSWQLTPHVSFDFALLYAVASHFSTRNDFSNADVTVLGPSGPIGFTTVSDPKDQTISVRMDAWQSQFGLTWRFD